MAVSKNGHKFRLEGNLYSFCYVFALFKNVENMSLQIANKIEINLCLFLNQFLYCSHNFVCYLSLLNLNKNKLLQLLVFLHFLRIQ